MRLKMLCFRGAVVVLTLSVVLQFSAAQVKLPAISQGASVTQTIGVTDVTIKYSRPGVKGRVIWGGLVPYDTLWRTGANASTTISFSDTVIVEGQKLPAGKYSLFTIPGKSEWTIIFNRDTTLNGAFGYKKENDALRITVKPQPAEHQEWMRFSLEDLTDNSAQVVLHWEKLKIPFTISVETSYLTLSKARKTLGYQGPMQFANYCLQRNINLDEAMKYIDISLMYEENYSNLRVKAQLLEKTGKRQEAVTIMEKAIAMGKEMKDPPFDFAQMQQMLADWKKKQ